MTQIRDILKAMAEAMWNTWNRVMVDYGLHKQSNGDFNAPEPTDDPIKAEAHRLLRKSAMDEAEAALHAFVEMMPKDEGPSVELAELIDELQQWHEEIHETR